MSEIKTLRTLIMRAAKQNKIKLRFSYEFDKQIRKIRDNKVKFRLFKQILKIVKNPNIGKYVQYSRKGEQEVYLDSFRLYYKYYSKDKILRFVEFSHKDQQ